MTFEEFDFRGFEDKTCRVMTPTSTGWVELINFRSGKSKYSLDYIKSLLDDNSKVFLVEHGVVWKSRYGKYLIASRGKKFADNKLFLEMFKQGFYVEDIMEIVEL